MNWKCNLQIILLLFIASTIFGQETLQQTLFHDEVDREYILYVPASYVPGKSVPLLFNFHGYTSNAFEQMNYGDFRPIADSANFIIVHPLGTRDAAGSTHFNVGWGGSTADDLGFTEALLDTIAANYSIDLNRVYSTGMSNGGFMSYQIACQLSDKFAAIASVTGSMSVVNYNSCDPQRPVPILEIHGTADLVVPFNGAIFSTSIDDVMDYWVAHNACDLNAVVTEIDDINTMDNSTVTLFEYKNGEQQVSTKLFKVNGGGHTWPSNQFVSAGTNFDIDASQEIWNFFDQYDLNGLRTTTSNTSILSNEILTYPNPVKDYLTIRYKDSEKFDLELLDFNGKSLLIKKELREALILDLSSFASGMYLLKIGNETRKICKK